VALRIVELENKMGPVTRAELNAVINAFARTLARYVPDEKLDEAEAFVRSQLGVAVADGTTAKRASRVCYRRPRRRCLTPSR